MARKQVVQLGKWTASAISGRFRAKILFNSFQINFKVKVVKLAKIPHVNISPAEFPQQQQVGSCSLHRNYSVPKRTSFSRRPA
jgi:hypothetical protein